MQLPLDISRSTTWRFQINRHALPRILAWLLAAFATAPDARAAAPEPPWKFEDSPRRAVFTLPPGQTHVMACLPATLPKGAIVGGIRAATANGDRQVRIIAAARDSIDVLVDCTGLAPRTPVALYMVPGANPPAADSSVVDPFPVRVEVRRAGGHDVPASYESLRFVSDRQLAPPFLMALPAFAPVESAPPNAWYQGGWQRPTYVASLSSWLIVGEAGDYTFALGDFAASFLAIDGRQCVAHPPEWAGAKPWETSEPIHLAPGLHRIEILTVCGKAIRVKAGWIPPGSEEIEPIPAARLACGGKPAALRLESRDSTLHASFTGRPGPAYVFRGIDTIFSPVRLESTTANWTDEPIESCEWSSDGRILGNGQSILAITSASGEVPVKLRVRLPSGVESTSESKVKLPRGPSREYLVSGRLFGVPSVCYDDDPVRPELHIRSTATPGVDLVASITATAPDGSKRTAEATVQLVRTWGRIELPQCFARDVASLEWSISHAGATLAKGRAVFHRAPYSEAPASLEGDTLIDADGSVCVLVAPRSSHGGGRRPFNRLVDSSGCLFLDGFFQDDTLPGFDGAGTNACPTRIRYLDLPSASDEMRFGRLAAIADAATLRRQGLFDGEAGGLVAIAPDISGLAVNETPEDFERRLAALVSLLQDVFLCDVILVTPPAGTVRMPAIAGGSDPDRLVARIVADVADATGASIADAYTLSRTHGGLSPQLAVEIAVERRILDEP